MRQSARRESPSRTVAFRRHAQGSANSRPSRSTIAKPVPPQCSQVMGTQPRWPIAEGCHSSSIQVAPEPLHLTAPAQLLLGLALDLADALAGEAQGLPDLLQRPRRLALEAEAHADHLRFLLIEIVHHGLDPLFEGRADHLQLRRRDGL